MFAALLVVAVGSALGLVEPAVTADDGAVGSENALRLMRFGLGTSLLGATSLREGANNARVLG